MREWKIILLSLSLGLSSLAFASRERDELDKEVKACNDFLKNLYPAKGLNGNYTRYNLIFESSDVAPQFAYSRLIAIPFLNVLSAQFTVPNMVMKELKRRMVVLLDYKKDVMGYSFELDSAIEGWEFRMDLVSQLEQTVGKRVATIPAFGFKNDDGEIISISKFMRQLGWAQDKLREDSEGKFHLLSPIYLQGVFPPFERPRPNARPLTIGSHP